MSKKVFVLVTTSFLNYKNNGPFSFYVKSDQ